MITEQDYITLKWGTLKSWRITNEEAKKYVLEYGNDRA